MRGVFDKETHTAPSLLSTDNRPRRPPSTRAALTDDPGRDVNLGFGALNLTGSLLPSPPPLARAGQRPEPDPPGPARCPRPLGTWSLATPARASSQRAPRPGPSELERRRRHSGPSAPMLTRCRPTLTRPSRSPALHSFSSER
jgi:hypothetical protein